MRIPAMLLGPHTDVERRARALVSTLGPLPSSDDIFGPAADLRDHPLQRHDELASPFGEPHASPLIILREKQKVLVGEHFRVYALGSLLRRSLHARQLEQWYEWCFREPWRFLLVLGDGAGRVFHGPLFNLRERYLEKALSFAPQLDSVGERLVDVGFAEHYSARNGILARIRKAAESLESEQAAILKMSIDEHLRPE